MKPLRIAILMHERDSPQSVGEYLVRLLVAEWHEDGHEVVFLFGTDTFIPADVLVVHVDLSVVPQEYIDFAARYPVTLNGRIRDIRKSTFSSQRLTRDSNWQGPVIVKTDANFDGIPERLRGVGPAGSRPAAGPNASSRRTWRAGYVVYHSADEVQEWVFNDPSLIVERFRPEVEEGFFCVRFLTCLGKQISSARLKGSNPIVNGSSVRRIEEVKPHEEIVAVRERLGCDYGKLDYVLVDGEPILLDVNKTVGIGRGLISDQRLAGEVRRLANGLYDYL